MQRIKQTSTSRLGAFSDILSRLISQNLKTLNKADDLVVCLKHTMLLQQRTAEHDKESTTGKRSQTCGDKIKYLFRVLQQESLSLESGAEDILQDKKIK